MYISENWLKEFVEIDISANELSKLLTVKTAEVEGFEDESKSYENMIIAEIISISAHPDADKLKVVEVSVGEKNQQIVCGGKNLKEGMLVAVALPGAEVNWHGNEEKTKLKECKIRGVESFGMICASEEIGLIPDKNEGPEDIVDLSYTKAKPGTALSIALGKNDIIYEFDNKTLTNRPDLWGHYGIAREISVLLDKKLKEYKTTTKIPEKGESIKVEVENKKLCYRYCGLIIDNVTVEDSPKWLKDKLQKTGHGCHNNIVDVTNYIMTELGQPMHAFDFSKIDSKIVVRSAQKDEKITALDEKEYKLDEFNLIIADNNKPLAIAGVIGGKNTGVEKTTKKIILEAATFDPISVRKTSTKLGVRTDSVQRFEKSLDPHMPIIAIEKAAELILKLCPDAKISGPITDIKNFNKEQQKTELSIEKACSKIGIKIKKDEIVNILNKLGFETKEISEDKIEITIPSFRATKDVEIEDDIIEEIARIYGYENLPAKIPTLPIKTPIKNTERKKKHEIRQLLSLNLGFHEMYNYSFYGKKEIEDCLLTEDQHLVIENSLSENLTHLRTTHIAHLLKNTITNLKNFKSFKIFEIARTYKDLGDFFPLEEKIISGLILNEEKNKNPFYEAKTAVEAIFKKLKIKGIKEVKDPTTLKYAHPKKCISYLNFNGESLAKVFIPHPQVIKNFNLEGKNIAIFEFNLTESIKMPETLETYKEISKFPKIEFDISVLINRETEIKIIHDIIQNVDKKLIQNIELFDIYEGKNIAEDKKAVAFKISLQAKDRTLTDEEMTKIQEKIFNELEKIGGEIRGR